MICILPTLSTLLFRARTLPLPYRFTPTQAHAFLPNYIYLERHPTAQMWPRKWNRVGALLKRDKGTIAHGLDVGTGWHEQKY